MNIRQEYEMLMQTATKTGMAKKRLAAGLSRLMMRASREDKEFFPTIKRALDSVVSKAESTEMAECKVGQTISGAGSDWKVEARKPDGTIVARDINTDKLREFGPDELDQFTVLPGLFSEGAPGVHDTPHWLGRVPADKVSATLKQFRSMGANPRAVYRDRSGQKRYYKSAYPPHRSGHSLKKHATHADIYQRGSFAPEEESLKRAFEIRSIAASVIQDSMGSGGFIFFETRHSRQVNSSQNKFAKTV